MTNEAPLRTRSPRASVATLYSRGRPNSLNLLRLGLASAVILWHTYAAIGTPYPADHGYSTLLGNFPVNGFFAVSGFLIYRSWVRKPAVFDYLVARVVRIYPAFWVCLVVTALAVAPLAVALQGGNPLTQAFSMDSLLYMLRNATLAMFQWRIGDTPADVPFLTSWNASLWTLAWEFLCYIGLLVLGVSGMLRRRWILPVAFAVSAAINVVAMIPEWQLEVIQRIGRFSIFFLAGAMVGQYAHRIRASWWLAIATLTVAIGSAWLPIGYNLVQAPAAAIGLVLVSGLFNPGWAQLRNDISYGVYIYAFPMQQLLAAAGLLLLNVYVFSLLALALTIPLAMASWFWIEKPALGLRKRIVPVPLYRFFRRPSSLDPIE